jgi:Anti-sigma-K factor rskA/Putative zinc-finger
MIEVIDCEQADELLPAYMLDVLDIEEAVAVATHLRTCERHRNEWQTLRPIVDSLALSVPVADKPSGAIKQQLLSQVRSIPRIMHRPLIARPAAFATVFIALVVLFGVGGWALSLQSQVNTQQAQLDRMTASQKSIQQFFIGTNVQTLPVKFTDQFSNDQATMYVANDRVALAVQGLPTLSGDQVYQCWWMSDSNDVMPGSTFKTDANGMGVWAWQRPAGSEYHILGITLENQSGLTQPQGPLVLKVQF